MLLVSRPADAVWPRGPLGAIVDEVVCGGWFGAQTLCIDRQSRSPGIRIGILGWKVAGGERGERFFFSF